MQHVRLLWRGDWGEVQTWVVQASEGNPASKMHSTCPLAPKLDSRRSVVALGLKAASTFTDCTPCTKVPLKCIFCTPEVWVWKYAMLYDVDQKHTSALALSKSDPNTAIFKETYNAGKVETDAVSGKLRKCKGRGKGRTARAPAPRGEVAPRKNSVPTPITRTETSQPKGGSGDSDELHGSEERSSGEEEDSTLIVTTLSCSLPFSPLLCGVRSWYAGCCCATRRLRVCYVPPLPLYYIGFIMGLFA